MVKSRRSPQWLEQGVMYQMFLRSFTSEGTLNAAAEKLPQLKELGVNIVYLCPICLQDDDMREEFWSDRQVKSGEKNPRNPYRVKDYFSVDPEYGTDEDLHAFVDKCHGLGMRVFLDIVYFHCGPTAVFLQEHPDFVKRNPDGSACAGEWHFPVLNFENEKLREYLYDNILYWVNEFGVDGYRCDAANHVPLDFWEESHRRLDATGKEIVLFAECCQKENQVQAFDLEYNYIGTKITRAVLKEETLESVNDYLRYLTDDFPQGAMFAPFMDNHDIANDAYATRREAQLGFDAINAAMVVVFTLKGVPFIYNGQEIADKARHSIYANYCIDWENAETEDGKKRFEFIKQLCDMRLKNSVLTQGEHVRVENDREDYVLSYLRKTESESLLVIVNLNSVAEDVCFDDAEFKGGGFDELISVGGDLKPSDRGLSASIAPYGFAVVKV